MITLLLHLQGILVPGHPHGGDNNNGDNDMETKVFVHLNPVWRDKANFIIGAKCLTEQDENQGWEQLWSRQIASNRFEICCIPFFVYDLALGDEVEAEIDPEWNDTYLIQKVTNRSGHYTFRVWFGDSPIPNIQDQVSSEIRRLGCLIEWYSENLLGIDADSDIQAQAVADYLWQKHQLGHLVYETGRT